MTALHPRPIKAAHELLLAKLCALFPPHIPVQPSPDDFEATREYLEDVARIVDQLILEVGREVQSNSSRAVDIRDFENVTLNALEADTLHYLTREADELRETRAA